MPSDAPEPEQESLVRRASTPPEAGCNAVNKSFITLVRCSDLLPSLSCTALTTWPNNANRIVATTHAHRGPVTGCVYITENASCAAQASSLQRTAGLTVTLFVVIALFLAAAQLGGTALSSIEQVFQENVTFTKKDFVPYSERLRCASAPTRPMTLAATLSDIIKQTHADALIGNCAGLSRSCGSVKVLTPRLPRNR